MPKKRRKKQGGGKGPPRGKRPRARPGQPSLEEWSTKIVELRQSTFSKADLAQVHECLSAIAPIEARGMKVVTRIELAALFLAAAIEHAFSAGEDVGRSMGRAGRGSAIHNLAGQLVVERAKEIYGNGGM